MIDVVLCASGAEEMQVVSVIASDLHDTVRVVRRCADLAEALGVIHSGVGDALIIDVDVHGLERTLVLECAHASTAVIGLRSPSSRTSAAEVGIEHTLSPGASADEVYACILEAVALVHDAADIREHEDSHASSSALAPLITVWGPSGAPGRTFVASNLAAAAARLGCRTMLVDADTTAPCITQVLGIIDEAPGLVAACRASGKGTLSEAALETIAPHASDNLRVMSGIGVPERYTEVHPSALAHVLTTARTHSDVVIVDVGASVEMLDDEYAAVARHAATRTCIEQASEVWAVVSADPVSMTRFIRESERLLELAQAPLSAIINRIDASADVSAIERSLRSRIEIARCAHVPYDAPAASRAAWDGILVTEGAARSASARALMTIARLWLQPAATHHAGASH